MLNNGHLLTEMQRKDTQEKVSDLSTQIGRLNDVLEREDTEREFSFNPVEEAILLYLQVHEEDWVYVDEINAICHKDDTEQEFAIDGIDPQKILIPDGEGNYKLRPSEEVMGIKGTLCLDLTSILEEKLGNVQWRKETPEYYQTLEQEENVTLQYDQNTN